MPSVPRDSIRTLAFNVLVTVVSTATGVLVARWLGPSGKGQISGLLMLRSVIAAFTAGMGAAVTYSFAKKGQTLEQLAMPLMAMIAAVSCLSWMALFAWGAVRGTSIAWFAYVAAVPASAVLALQNAFYTGLNRIRRLNYQTLALSIATFVAVVIAVSALHTATPGALVATAVCLNIGAAVVLAQIIRPKYLRARDDWPTRLKDLMVLGLRWTALGLMAFMTYRTDSILVATLLGAAFLGIYSVAVSAAELLLMISRSVATASVFRISSSSRAQAAELTARAIRLSTYAVVVAAVALFAFGPALLRLFYGTRFDGASLPLRILIPGTIVFASSGIFAQFLTYQLGRPAIVVYLGLGLIVVQVGGSLLLIPKFGLAGAAWASTITYSLEPMVETAYFCKITGLSVRDVWFPRMADVRQLVHAAKSLVAS